MREDYKAAKRLAEAAVRKAESEGVSPYLPVLDALEDMKTSLPQIRLGIMELPLSRITGNKEQGRNNAFAIGVSLIDPECKVVIQRADHENVTDYREVWKQQGIEFYADIEYSMVLGDERLGLYRIGETSDTFIGTPYYSWGKYYAQIIQTVLMGTWKSDSERTMSANYWFGMSTGVVDIRTKDLPYQTDKLLRFFRKAIIDGSITPFSGMIKGQDGSMVQEYIAMIARKRLEFGEMTPDMIISMDWLNENIVGEI